MDDPLGVGDRIAQPGEIGWLPERDRIDQMSPRSSAAQLDQIGALAVAKSVRPFGIDSDWPGSATECGDGLVAEASGVVTIGGTPSAGAVSNSAS